MELSLSGVLRCDGGLDTRWDPERALECLEILEWVEWFDRCDGVRFCREPWAEGAEAMAEWKLRDGLPLDLVLVEPPADAREECTLD